MSQLLKAIFLVMFLSAVATSQPSDSPFLISDIKATEVSPGVVDVHLTTTTRQQIPPVATVPVATGPLLLEGEIPLRQLDEENLLGSFMEVDLNGDRMLDPVLVRQNGDGLRIDGAPVEAMGALNGPQQPYRADGKMRRYVLSPDAPFFSVLYYTPPAMGLLLEHRTDRVEVLELPNPHLQLVVFEHSDPVEGQRFLPDPPAFQLTIDGQAPAQKNLLYAWEPALFKSMNLSPRWLRGWWIAVPLDANPGVKEHHLRVTVGPGDSALGLYAQVNYATSAGVRLRTNRSTGVIWSPAPKK